MQMDAKTLTPILTAAALAASHFYGQSTVASARQDLGVGVVQFVAGELDSRDKAIADLTERIRVLEEKR